MKEVLSAVLASPRFLYLYDGGDTEEKSVQIENINLASRLSFFLWGSLPDKELLNSAKDGTLSREETLKKHGSHAYKSKT